MTNCDKCKNYMPHLQCLECNENDEQKIEQPKRKRGRPRGALGRNKLTPEEAKERKRIYDVKYQFKRYNSDEEYRTAIRDRQTEINSKKRIA